MRERGRRERERKKGVLNEGFNEERETVGIRILCGRDFVAIGVANSFLLISNY
jgi:hypothetical protein